MLTFSTVRDLHRECREQARLAVAEKYALYDRIWAERIRITQALYDHGEDVVKAINDVMPNLLTRRHPELRSIDEAAEAYGFESTSALVEYLLAYVPKKGLEERLSDQLFDTRLREMARAQEPELVADIPF